MRDRLAVGALSGFLAQLAKFPLGWLTVSMGLARHGDFNVAAGIFLSASTAVTSVGRWLGFVGTLVIASILGIALSYILSITGKDYWWLKGPGFGAFAWVAFWGILVNLGATRIQPLDLGSNIMSLILYIFWGTLTAWVAIKLADDELYAGVHKLK